MTDARSLQRTQRSQQWHREPWRGRLMLTTNLVETLKADLRESCRRSSSWTRLSD
jgi:hypothetical protein